ncbi:hypothetical protein [Legionella oakridgensis]|uniref:Fe-S protein n=2 Tax=Legionella oakridgensis TaxID=29423 RepID=W0BEZ8_9GAMM|nr:hypothetical protein [Legionella oakridgensis]AHE67004.1 hypothetical protein Loa_01452 [Legionella oakridgensis ATCC 33761 = DSM 21215]KTD38345.1 Fe-S protein [Legionella oakridgensis]STY20102.1 Fe-S protein [Legionella longbeachae]
MQKIVGSICLAACFVICDLAYGDPWFTGPLLAPSGKTIPRGHVNLETYGFYTENSGMFDRHWKLIEGPASQNIQINPLFSYGLTDFMDLQFSLPYVINRSQGQTGRHIGDTAASLGLQVLKQNQSWWRPDLRVSLQQVFPTGRYEEFNPINQGTAATGIGSYQTALGFNFQHLNVIGQTHYFRQRLSLTYLYAASVNIRGHNSYGGNMDTKGSIKPGNLSSVDLAGELSITQNWVAVMEAYYFIRGASKFQGNPGFNTQGLPLTIGHATIAELSLAPAIEYNFSANYGIIAGVWFSSRGKDAPDFMSTVVAFNAFW